MAVQLEVLADQFAFVACPANCNCRFGPSAGFFALTRTADELSLVVQRVCTWHRMAGRTRLVRAEVLARWISAWWGCWPHWPPIGGKAASASSPSPPTTRIICWSRKTSGRRCGCPATAGFVIGGMSPHFSLIDDCLCQALTSSGWDVEGFSTQPFHCPPASRLRRRCLKGGFLCRWGSQAVLVWRTQLMNSSQSRASSWRRRSMPPAHHRSDNLPAAGI